MLVLRDYQEKCVQNVIEDLETYTKLCCILSTGSGKTCIFIELIDRLKEKTLILSRSRLLTTQTSARFKKFKPDIKVGILQGKRIPAPDCDVVIATVQSACIERKVAKWLKQQSDIKYIVLDESHTLLDTQQYQDAISHHNSKVIGFTATPFKKGYLFNNLFDKISFSISMQELIDKKWLVPIELRQIMKPVDIEDAIAFSVEIYRENELGKKAIVYYSTVEEAKMARNVFEMRGIQASVVTGDVKQKTRDSIFREFERGDTDVLCTCDVLTAGFDCPVVEVIIMPHITKSPTQFIQRCGRGMRPQDAESVKPEHSKQTCRIYAAGDPPMIKNGFYKKVLTFALNEGTLEYNPDVFDELDFLEITNEPKSSEKYVWTKEICKIVARMEEMGLLKLASKLRKKEFPRQYLRHIHLLHTGLQGPIEDTMESLELSIRNNSDKFMITRGKYTGWHVGELPKYTKHIFLSKYPDSEVSRLIRGWMSEQQR